MTNPGGRPESGREQRAHDEILREANRDMPGIRAGLPPGRLKAVMAGPHSDENRDQPRDSEGRLRKPDPPPR